MSFANLLLCHFLLNPFKLFIYFLTKCLTFSFFSFILPVIVLSFLFFFESVSVVSVFQEFVHLLDYLIFCQTVMHNILL